MIDDQTAEHDETRFEEAAAHADDDGQRGVEQGDESDIDAVDKGDLVEDVFLVGEPLQQAEEETAVEDDQQEEDDGSDKEVVAFDPRPPDLQPGHHERRTGQDGQGDAAAQEVDEIGSLSLHQGEGVFRAADVFQAADHIPPKTVEDIAVEADEDDHDDGGLPRIVRRRDRNEVSLRGELYGEGGTGAPYFG